VAVPGPDDPNVAGDESLTGIGMVEEYALPNSGVAWSIGAPNQYDGLKPAIAKARASMRMGCWITALA